jgi:hypothetical protein
MIVPSGDQNFVTALPTLSPVLSRDIVARSEVNALIHRIADLGVGRDGSLLSAGPPNALLKCIYSFLGPVSARVLWFDHR